MSPTMRFSQGLVLFLHISPMIKRCSLRMRKIIISNKYRRISLMDAVVADCLYEGK